MGSGVPEMFESVKPVAWRKMWGPILILQRGLDGHSAAAFLCRIGIDNRLFFIPNH
ncbi:hypothetical protein GGR39_002560 [Novosphingobium fluoreni]|uniref:Uncharacterized protein n=1 Tax=Novosphingobium fluoreni TaxID=1391222 RepID=A0A7W6C1Q2_9SPHN|nr:hypothetical protein [Novosphingobium fluoreni]MBB3940897.1 hypothetical protein [Novosphingobium fluoreni]